MHTIIRRARSSDAEAATAPTVRSSALSRPCPPPMRALADAAIPNLTVAVMAQNDAAIRLYRRRGLVAGELTMYRIGGGAASPPNR